MVGDDDDVDTQANRNHTQKGLKQVQCPTGVRVMATCKATPGSRLESEKGRCEA